MLKEGREKITPLEVPDWIQEAMLKEQAPWYAHVAFHTWLLLGAGGLFLLAVFLVALLPFPAGKEQNALETSPPKIEATPVNQPAQEEQTVRLSITSTPSGAAVYLNADSIGVTPLVSRIKKTDIWVLSLQKPDYVAFDTVLFLENENRAYLHRALRPEGPLPVADATDTAAALEAPPRQPTTAPLSTPVASEAPTAAQREPPTKPLLDTEQRDNTALDAEQRAPGRHEGRATSDPLNAALPKTATALASPEIETSQTQTERNDETNAASETPLHTLLPRTQTQVPADLQPIPELGTFQRPTAGDDETDTASEAHQEPIDASNSPPRNTRSSRRSAETRSRGRGKKLDILEVQGKRTLDAEEIGYLTVVTSADVIAPATFLWEWENGVFALGRSINIQFNQAGVYTITVTAKNEYGVDTETLTITVTEPPPSQPQKEDG
jgi:hypothetical protein